MDFTMQWLMVAAGYLVVIINAMALLIITIGTVQAFIRCLRALFGPSETGHELRSTYLRYARWLIAGLTFQLAADIIETAGAPSWDEVGRLGAIAFIRTFLSFFLERDIAETRELQREDVVGPANLHAA
jgi:uncharacterized membrane protein